MGDASGATWPNVDEITKSGAAHVMENERLDILTRLASSQEETTERCHRAHAALRT